MKANVIFGGTGLRGRVAPVANAGPDQNIDSYEEDGYVLVTLDGSGSVSDPDNPIVTYIWTEDTLNDQNETVTNLLAISQNPVVQVRLSGFDNRGVHNIKLTTLCKGANYNIEYI